MPLFDFRCAACQAATTLLLKPDDAAVCPVCASPRMVRLLSPFAVGGRAGPGTTAGGAGEGTGAGAVAGAAATGGHTCSAGCSHGKPASAPAAGAGCATAAYADSLVKKYLG